MGILPGLLFIEADHVPLAVDHPITDFQGRRVFCGLARGSHFNEIVADDKELVPERCHRPHPDAQDVIQLQRVAFQFFYGVLADHATVGHDADRIDLESFLQSLHDWNQCGYVRHVAGPHLATDGMAVLVQYRADHHLHQVRPVVLAVAAAANILAAFPFEIQAGRVEEYQFQFREEVLLPQEKLFLDQVLPAPVGEMVRAHLSQGLTEPIHGTVQLVKGDILDAVDAEIVLPFFRRPIAA